MIPFFKNENRQAALWAQAQTWIGTPFFKGGASCGHGVDCVNLVHELLVGAGMMPRVTLPAYTLDSAKHAARSQLLVFLLTTPELAGRFSFVPFAGKHQPGDLLGLACGHADHHLAIVMPFDRCLHAIDAHGVILSPLDEAAITRRIVYVLRPLEVSP